MKEKILRLKSEGKSYREIAAELGCSKGTISYHLGEGQHEKSLDRTRRRRRLDAGKVKVAYGARCVKCSYNRCLAALQFHHRDPSQKKFEISGRSKGLKALMEEAKKCDLLCSNCHAEIHNCPDITPG